MIIYFQQIVNEDTNAPDQDVETDPLVDESTVNDTADVTTTNMNEKVILILFIYLMIF
jgi:hypothetical protein